MEFNLFLVLSYLEQVCEVIMSSGSYSKTNGRSDYRDSRGNRVHHKSDHYYGKKGSSSHGHSFYEVRTQKETGQVRYMMGDIPRGNKKK